MKELPTFCTSTMVMFGTIATKSRGILDSRGLNLLSREHIHRDRHVLERLVALARRDHDLVELKEVGFAPRRIRANRAIPNATSQY